MVRRNAGLAAVIGAASSAIAIAYLWRAVDTGAVLDWALCVVLALIAGFYLTGLLDARTPLVVADHLGVRIRLGNQWRGLPWEAVASAEVHPRRSILHDGRLVFRPHRLGRALDGLDVRGRRHAALNQKLYGAALAVPLGLTTRSSSSGGTLAQELLGLSHGRADVLVVAPEPTDGAEPADRPETAAASGSGSSTERTLPAGGLAAPVVAAPAVAAPTDRRDEAAGHPQVETDAHLGSVTDTQTTTQTTTQVALDGVATDPDEPGEESGSRRSFLGGIATIVSRVAKANRHDVDAPHPETVAESDAGEAGTAGSDAAGSGAAGSGAGGAGTEPGAGAGLVAPLRAARPALRAQVTRDTPATTLGAAALHENGSGRRPTGLPEGRELHRPGSVDLEFEPVTTSVRPIATLGEPVEPLVIDDFVTEPAYDPVIGPELAAARTRVGLTVDELAERTRIRPHVIESIEVDDFAPCGGDFYARGHLRTLARVLGQDPAPLLATFDERYATAPINARRVFEAELATGMTGTMRSTLGGPNWGLLIGAVLSLVLIWGVVRLFATEPAELLQDPTPVLNGSAGVDSAFPSSAEVAKAQDAGRPMPMMLVASQAGTHVVVRDGEGKVAFAGDLVFGERKKLKVEPPVHVRAANAGAVELRVRGKDRGFVGALGEPGRRTLHRPAR